MAITVGLLRAPVLRFCAARSAESLVISITRLFSTGSSIPDEEGAGTLRRSDEERILLRTDEQ